MKIGTYDFNCLPAYAPLMLLLALTSPTSGADAILIDENFDDVAVTNSTATPDVSTVLAALPSSSLWYSTNSTSADVNVRRGDNLLNTNTVDGFGSYFNISTSNRLLILGDQAGPLGTTSNSASPTAPGNGTFAFAIPFVLDPGATHITVQFDWAFAGRDLSAAELEIDSFFVGIAGEEFDIGSPASYPYELLAQFSPTNTFGDYFHLDGNLAVTLALADLPVANASGIRHLVFSLAEANSPGNLASELGNSAVGIDNIKVTAVPLPASGLLLFTTLAGLLPIGRLTSRAYSKTAIT